MKNYKKRTVVLFSIAGLIGLISNMLPADENINKINERLTQIEKILSKQGLLELSSDLEKLEEEQRSLKGRIEEVEFFVDSQKIDNSGLSIQNKNEPIRTLNNYAEKSSNASMPVENELEKIIQNKNKLAANVELTESELYKQSFGLLKAADYENAIIGFREYLSKFADGKFAANSMFWIGEAYWVTQDYTKAIEEYTELTRVFPESQKSSHALLKIGYCYEKLGKEIEARKALEYLQEKFPNSTASRLGLVKLEKLKKDIN